MAKRSIQQPKRAAKDSPAKDSKRFPWLWSLVPVVLALLVYANTAQHGYVLDDLPAITENQVVMKGTESWPTIWKTNYRYGYWNEPGTLYRPLPLMLFAWQWEHWPMDSSVPHIMNILLFGVSVWLIFLLLYGWVGKVAAAVAASLFAVHPIHTEVVANIKSADELLSFLFGMLSLWLLSKNDKRVFSLHLAGALVAFFLALSSKEGAVTLVPVAGLALYFFGKHDWKTSVRSALWLLLPTAAYMMLRHQALGTWTSAGNLQSIDNMLVGLAGAERIATTIKICGLYLWKLIVPATLSHDYSLFEIKAVGLLSGAFWLSLAAYAALVFFAVRLWRSRHPIAFALWFFLLTFSLYSNTVLLIGTHFGERLLFLPSLAFCLIVGWLVDRQWGLSQTARKTAVGAFFVLVLVYSGKTIDRNQDWKSAIDLYEADIVNAPESCRTHYRLGMAYMKEKAILISDPEERKRWILRSMQALENSLKIDPTFTEARSEYGLAYQRLGDNEQAMVQYRIALEQNPTHTTTLNNVGTVYFEMSDYRQAITYFERAIDKDPRYKDAIGNLASCYGAMGEYEKAIEWFKRAVELDPTQASYHYFIGVTFNNMGRPNDAAPWLEKAYALNPALRPK